MRPSSSHRVGVVGGSLAGLTVALLLRDAGHDVDVYERSDVERTGYGAGMALHEPTYRYLVERAGKALDELTVSTPFERFLDRDGRIAHQRARKTYFSTWGTLYRALVDAYGLERFHSETTVVSVDPPDGRPVSTLRFADGTLRSFDFVVGADGIQSTIRASLGAATEFRSAGYVGWRGLVPRSRLTARTFEQLNAAVTYFIGDRTHILTYPVPHGLEDDANEQRLNYVWYRNFSSEEELDEILTDASGVRRAVSLPAGTTHPRQVDRLRDDAQALLSPQFAELVCATEQPFVQLIGDLAVNRMVFGHTVLVGDAAFVARPHPAAGAAKACADAWALASAIGTSSDGVIDLDAWQRERLGEGRRLVEYAVSQGERVQRLGTWEAGEPFFIPELFRRREASEPHTGPRAGTHRSLTT